MGQPADHASVGEHATILGHNIQNSTFTALLREPTSFPAQLPRPVEDFTGRTAEIEQLVEFAGHGAAVVVTAIEGTAGVGKTALAVHAGHQVKHQFPDGQLYADLLGYTVGRTSATPGDVAAGFLHSLGIPAEDIPTQAEARTAAFRDIVSRRRLLVVLDNARREDQVRPLLPASGSSLVIVTSRHVLAGLDGVQRMPLDVLTEEEALDLLATTAGRQRVAAEPEAAHQVNIRCGKLPLAVRIAGRLLETEPGLTVADLAAALGDERERLAELKAGDLAVRSAFELSFRALPDEPSRMFTLLGLHPGPEISVDAAMALDGTATTRQIARLMRELHHAHLLESVSAGRYRMHDLIRLFAADRAAEDLHDVESGAAAQRLVVYYVRATQQAVRDLHGDESGARRAAAWLGNERDVVEAIETSLRGPSLNPRRVWLYMSLYAHIHYQRSESILAEHKNGSRTKIFCLERARLISNLAVAVRAHARNLATSTSSSPRLLQVFRHKRSTSAELSQIDRVAAELEQIAAHLRIDPNLETIVSTADTLSFLIESKNALMATIPIEDTQLASALREEVELWREASPLLDRINDLNVQLVASMDPLATAHEEFARLMAKFANDFAAAGDRRSSRHFRRVAWAWQIQAKWIRRRRAELDAILGHGPS
ncbi:NB-ARC domain-containing protein [Kutzneria buriramensis]|uniref:NB-ARC domain-containing protein n=1 Tax=Kutzneria buriramensis TaxID=1045776 RepID=A0A3E0HYN0_9PSEU|nr:NB-ARC domain-containing protein [Kutzneria buriramensis]REH51582.1 NB-ARC domain-containing protein [Kutzneria buriramensis]